MRKRHGRGSFAGCLPAWSAGLALLICGCTNQDTDHLARMARKAAAKGQTLIGGAGSKLTSGWQAMRGDLDDMALDARVSARLRWDKTLAGTPIEIHAQGTLIELKGTVADLAQRRRAVELAESTAGVEKVSDNLEVATHEP